MSKSQKAEPQNKPDILHLLKYCRIDRAAELLGCEVSDLLHLEEICAISLFWNFDNQPAITRRSWMGRADGESISDCGDVIPVGCYSDAVSAQPGGIVGEIDPEADIPILLRGLWEAEDRLDPTVRTEGPREEPIMSFSRSVNGSTTMVAIPVQCSLPPDNELFILQDDLRQLRNAIITGRPLENPLYAAGEDKAQPNQLKDDTCRGSHKLCVALVDVLKALGFTADDFMGSIPQLKLKLARKECGAVLTGVDNKTLIDWLTKARAR